MPGGKGNIRPEDNTKPFSKENQPDEKWTQKAAIKLGDELIEWLKVKTKKKKANNLFVEDFLVMHKNLPAGTFGYLNKKFSTFSQLYEQAKKIQEIKLAKCGLNNDFNSTITKFVLTNHHDYRDKVDQKVIDKAPTITYVDVTGRATKKD